MSTGACCHTSEGEWRGLKFGFCTSCTHFESSTLVLEKAGNFAGEWTVSSKQLAALKEVFDHADQSKWNGLYWGLGLDGYIYFSTITRSGTTHQFQGWNGVPACSVRLIEVLDGIATGHDITKPWSEETSREHYESWEELEPGFEEPADLGALAFPKKAL